MNMCTELTTDSLITFRAKKKLLYPKMLNFFLDVSKLQVLSGITRIVGQIKQDLPPH